MEIVLLFPGQGSQRPGMARDLADEFSAAREALAAVDAALAVGGAPPITPFMFDGPPEELTRTQHAQPALFAHAAALLAVLGTDVRVAARAAAGHSLGEFSAYHAAGALALADGARLVRARGELMATAGNAHAGAMAAILGTLSRSVDDICRDASEGDSVVVPANFNADEQIVISGAAAAVDRAIDGAKAAGAKRAMRLTVSGAFHSPLMEPAAAGLAAALDAVTWETPSIPVYANVDAAPRTTAVAARESLLQQLTSPVRWTNIMRRLAAEYPRALFVELGPGSVLAGLARRVTPDIEVVACGTASEVHLLQERLRR